MVLLRFSAGCGFDATLTRLLTRSDFGQVGFSFEDGTVLDAASGRGVSSHHDEADDGAEYYRILAPTKLIARAVEWAHQQIGRPYDRSTLWPRLRNRRWHAAAGRWSAAELIEASFIAAAWPLLRDSRGMSRVLPTDLLGSTRIVPFIPSPRRAATMSSFAISERRRIR